MSRIFKLLAPVILLAIAIYCVQESYNSYALMRLHLYLNDPSGAELYELNFQLFTPAAVVAAGVGCFLAGRWWFR